MKRNLRHVTSIALLFLLSAVVAESSSRRILPESDPESIRVRIGGKWSSYHLATEANPVELALTGPISIRVLSRVLLEPNSPTDTTPYQVCIEIDGIKIRILEEIAGVSTKAELPEGHAIGTLEKSTLQIPEGVHRARIYPLGEGTRVALRFFRGNGHPVKIKYVPFAPESYEEPILLHSGDSEVTYYRFNPEVPIVFSVNGPVQMKALTRLDFNHERGYSKAYAIKVSLDGELQHTSRLTSRASATSIYPDRKEITPGVGKDLMIDIPEGRHEISIRLDCTTADGASLRLLIPEKAVTNEL